MNVSTWLLLIFITPIIIAWGLFDYVLHRPEGRKKAFKKAIIAIIKASLVTLITMGFMVVW